jgi:hypothetical protein
VRKREREREERGSERARESESGRLVKPLSEPVLIVDERVGTGLRFTFALLPGDRHTTKHGAGEKSMHDKLVVAELLLVVAMKLVDKATEHKLSAACRDRLAKLHANHQLAVQQQLAQQQRKREKAAGSDKRRKDK